MISNEYEIVNKLILSDIGPTGKKYDWQGYKLKSLELRDSYERISLSKDDKRFYNRAERVSNCANFLEFKRYFETNERKLHKGYFCKDPLCPGCTKRRSMKIYGQTAKVMEEAIKKYDFLFLTLTVKNCSAENLKETIDLMFSSWSKFFKRKAIKIAFKGYFRALEITHNTDFNSPSYDTYHPHFHAILAVRKGYFTGKEYIKHSELVRIWRESLGVDYDPIVDITRFRAANNKQMSKSLAEAAKYTVKDNDYLIEGDIDLTDASVYILALALRSRRLIAYGGVLKDIHKILNLDDPLDGDLINTDSNTEDYSNLSYIIETFRWGVGLTGEINYFLWDISTPDFGAR